jgi:lysylphosphatidylglycerol synthetase-like protein (DUF2156 family)
LTVPADAATGERATSTARRVTLLILRRCPFTVAVVVALLVVGAATTTLWHATEHQSWYPNVAFGLPSFEKARWWTLVTGPWFAISPIVYLPLIVSFALLVGYTEWQVGTRRAATYCVGGQLVGVVGAAFFLWIFRDSGWTWAHQLAGGLDVGFSAGALASIAIVTARIRAPWRLRVRAVLVGYVAISVLYVGTLANLEHAVAVAVALPLGHRLVGGVPAHDRAGPSRREWRLIAAVGLAVIAGIRFVVWLLPGNGPLGSTAGTGGSAAEVAVVLVVTALLVNGLRRGRRVAWRWAVGFSGFFVALALLAAVLLIVAGAIPGPNPNIDVGGEPLFVADGVLWAGMLLVLIAGRHAFAVPGRRRRRRGVPGAVDRDEAVALLRRHGGDHLSWMTTWPANSYFGGDGTQAYVAYRVQAGVALGLGDPVGLRAARLTSVRSFASMCDAAGLTPCLFSVGASVAAAAEEIGWQSLQVAEDTVIDLAGLEFRGKSWQGVRTALNRAKKEGIEYRLVALADEPRAVIHQVREISEEWVGDKGLPEMGFTLGGVDEALDRQVRVGLATDGDGRVQGVTSWLPVYDGSDRIAGWTLDVMRRRSDGFRPVVEYLIASACLAFQAEGADFISLSAAPLARSESAHAATTLDRLLDALGAALEPYYGFRSLHTFKMKFKPRYEPLYLVYRDEADLPRIGIALTRAYLPDADARDLLRLATTGRE